jgi:hypothetical protein
MTLTEGLAIASGLAIGYWLVAVLIPSLRVDRHSPPDTSDGLPPGEERDEAPSRKPPSDGPSSSVEM